MFIKLHYFIDDCGDGSAALRVFSNEKRCEIAFNKYPDSKHLSDYSISEMVLDTNDFEEVKEGNTPSYKPYDSNRTDPSGFDAWINHDDFSEEDVEKLKLVWEELEAEGNKNPVSLIAAIADIMLE